MKRKKYNFVIESLDKGYHDPDTVMLHSAFQCLVDFVEKEDGLTCLDKEVHGEEINRSEELYRWWLEYSSAEDPNKVCSYEEASCKLKELVDIRGFLWT